MPSLHAHPCTRSEQLGAAPALNLLWCLVGSWCLTNNLSCVKCGLNDQETEAQGREETAQTTKQGDTTAETPILVPPLLALWPICGAFDTGSKGRGWREGQVSRGFPTQLLWWAQEQPSMRPAPSNTGSISEEPPSPNTHFPPSVVNWMMPREHLIKALSHP